ncbi:MAG: endonuclease III domain-containing protein [Aquificae bacterium]|nr:endonuclease III domain-containing protein [Aquificota bacterium]
MSGAREGALIEIYERLLRAYGRQNWWPVDHEYHRKNGTDPREEVCIGAILTQNTAWRNVEKALKNLKERKILSFKGIRQTPVEVLGELIRPAGFYRVKAGYLKGFVEHFPGAGELERATREELLAVKGVGKETADVILLYALGRPSFVVDAYTRRLLSRLWGITGSYEKIKAFFEENLPRNVELFKEFHALIDEHAKRHCRKRPLCEGCPLRDLCGF